MAQEPVPSFWPEQLGDVMPVTPKSILEVQAKSITTRTAKRLCGEVRTAIHGNTLSHTLELVTPALDGYRHFVVRIRHGLETMYPLQFFGSEREDTPQECTSQTEFTERLASVLQSTRMVSVVRSLLALSQYEGSA